MFYPKYESMQNEWAVLEELEKSEQERREKEEEMSRFEAQRRTTSLGYGQGMAAGNRGGRWEGGGSGHAMG